MDNLEQNKNRCYIRSSTNNLKMKMDISLNVYKMSEIDMGFSNMTI